MPDPAEAADDRRRLETLLGTDLRRVTSLADRAASRYACRNGLNASDFKTLLLVVMAGLCGEPLCTGDLRLAMGRSGAGVKYLVDRLTDFGHIQRVGDPSDRRRIFLHHTTLGMRVAEGFIMAVDSHAHRELEGLTDTDLEAAHRTFAAFSAEMRALRADLERETR